MSTKPKLSPIAGVGVLVLPASYSHMLPLILAFMQASPPAPDSAAVRREARELQSQFERFRRENLPISEVGKDKCEVRIGRFCYWYDPADPPLPDEPKEIADARADFLAQLENLATYSPTDPWILAQRVRYTVEQGLPDSAAAIASCGTWWCRALAAYAYYYKGDVGTADSLYTKAMSQAPMGVRCDWNHLGQALEPQEKAIYDRLDCRQRDSVDAYLFWRGRPAFSRPGNDVRVQWYARMTAIRAYGEGVTHHGMTPALSSTPAPRGDARSWSSEPKRCRRALTLPAPFRYLDATDSPPLRFLSSRLHFGEEAPMQRDHTRSARYLLAASFVSAASLGSALPASAVSQPQPPATEAQEPPSIEERVAKLEKAAAKAAEKPTVKAGADGFRLESADGDFSLRLRGYVQLDGRFFQSDDQRPATDTFTLRRVRPILEGTVYKIFDFRIMPDFGGGQTVLQDAYLEGRFTPAFKVRAGKFKAPVGLERLQSATDLLFVERAFPTNLVPNRDLGVQLSGDLAGGVATYAVGVFNGVPDGGSADGDTNDNKDYAARIFFQPFIAGSGPLKNLGFGVAGSTGNQEGTVTAPNLPAFRTPGQQTFFSYRTDGTVANTVIADGDRTRFSPQGYFYSGPFGLLAEYVTSKQAVRRGTVSQDLQHKAWQVAAYWVFGGKASYRECRPDRGVRPRSGDLGRLRAGRASGRARHGRGHLPVVRNPATSASGVEQWTIGVNWYLNRNLKLNLNYDDFDFEGGAADGDRPAERVILARMQVSF